MLNVGNGTVASVIGTEITLATLNVPGIFVFVVDKAAMQTLDVLTLRVYSTVLEGGASRVAYVSTFANAQPSDDEIAYSVPVPSDVEYHVTLQQTAGSPRQYPWKVLQIG